MDGKTVMNQEDEDFPVGDEDLPVYEPQASSCRCDAPALVGRGSGATDRISEP